MEPLLVVNGVSRDFGGFIAIDNISFTLQSGERRALIGPNGAGKSTLFSLLSGRLRPNSGSIRYEEREIQGCSAAEICRLGIARTFQITSIFWQLSPIENVQIALIAHHGQSFRILRSSRRAYLDEAAELLAHVGLGDKHGGRCGLLSYGDQKRLELAITLAMNPRLLLLDEPTAGMEAQARRDIVALIKRLCDERSLTLLFCEHDMESVFSIAETITVLHQGRIVLEGAPDVVRGDEMVRSIYLGTQHGAAS
jgi:branched-chain amino acid transport system ATP-binding protein